jgi:predicted nucleotidyltransferase
VRLVGAFRETPKSQMFLRSKMKNKYLNIAKKIILSHLNCDEVNVFLFGSRVRNDSRRNADMDIGLLAKKAIDQRTIRKITDDLQDSLVPYHFDLIDFSKVNENFKNIALKEIIIWNKAKNLAIN